jgi:hypothetical protein
MLSNCCITSDFVVSPVDRMALWCTVMRLTPFMGLDTRVLGLALVHAVRAITF